MSNKNNLQSMIVTNAKRIRDLHAKTRTHPTYQLEDFFNDYVSLAFPEKLGELLENRDFQADLMTIEYALTFVEVRPYFFRSQYIRTALIRRLKRQKLKAAQKARLDAVLADDRQRKNHRMRQFRSLE